MVVCTSAIARIKISNTMVHQHHRMMEQGIITGIKPSLTRKENRL
jgi:hypothetical protein